MAVDKRSSEHSVSNPGPYLARVISNNDPKYMGSLQVQLLRDVGNVPDGTGSVFQVKYMSPFYGVTSLDHLGSNDTIGDTQKSYGMWMVPPDPGALVIVMFIMGDARQGYWIGCVPDENMNFMVPGLAATELHNEATPGKRVVGEYNKRFADGMQNDSTKIKKPVHNFNQVLQKQGLVKDEVRGTTTSSARRESPSNVFGISTPGPIDRSQGAPKGNIGKHESRITGAFVSRLGGSTFVMDDGDENFLRKTHAKDGPPQYASVENGDKGDVNIPQNELIRIRTRTGHQILLHNSEDLIYICNSRGTAWIELTSEGKIDIWAADSISMHTAKDFNLTADNNINLTAGGEVNISSVGNFNATTFANYNISADANGNLQVGGQSNIRAGGNHIETAAQIHMNGPQAASASPASKAPRVPMAEPWAGHENLHGAGLVTTLDTFKKIGK
jgi:hypothetical protein